MNEQRDMFYKWPFFAIFAGLSKKEKSLKLSMFQGFASFYYSS